MADEKEPDITIVGGGVAGLNTGIEALKQGYRNVTIFEAEILEPALAQNPGQKRVSYAASICGMAQLYPFIEGVGAPGSENSREIKWIEDAADLWLERETINRYKETMARRRNIEFMKEEDAAPMPDYLREVFKRFGPVEEFGEVPQNPLAFVYGYDFTTLALNSPAVTQAMIEEFRELGGNMVVRKINSADEFYSLPGDVIVNCLGMGAKDIFPQLGLEPVKGHLIFYKNPGIETIVSAYDFIMLPRSKQVLAVGAGYFHQFDTDEPTEDEAKQILDGVSQMISIDIDQLKGLHEKLAGAEFIGETTGFRPYRKSGVLVAAEVGPNNQVVIQNVGHGGIGWTLAGTGKAAVRLIKENS